MRFRPGKPHPPLQVCLICVLVCASVFASGLPLTHRLVRASAPLPFSGETDSPDKTLPDLDLERALDPPQPEAAPEIQSTMASWSTYDGNLNAPVNPIVVTITAPANNASFSQGSPVTINATVTASTIISAVSFRANGVSLGNDKTAPYSLTYSSLAPGNYALTAVAQDTSGGTGTSAAVNITVTGGSASITSPNNGAQFPAPANIPISATATPSSGHTISRVDFFAGATLIDNDTTAPYGVTWPNVPAGTYSLTVRAVENAGGTTTSAAISVTVVSGASAPTVNITSPANNSQFTAPVNISIAADATPSAGRTITKVDFYYDQNNFIGTDTSSPYAFTWNGAPTGAHVLTAVATDNFNATGTSGGINVTVNAGLPPTANITNPMNGANYPSAPATVFINAEATPSSGRIITKVEFFSNGGPINTDFTAPYSYTWQNVPAGTYSLTAKATDNTNATGTSSMVTITVSQSSPPPAGDNFSTARLDPINRTGSSGEDLFSRNFNWGIPILSLPGRSGLDLGLGLAYNSLVWTRDGSQIKFDADNGFPTAGFRLGFPVIQQRYLNAQIGQFAYLMITPSGRRVELRQVGSTTTYESADSSYLQLTDNGGGSLLVRSADGSQLSYALVNSEHRCTQIKDRNGNYITAAYDGAGRITVITDTLARSINFDYDAFGHVTSIWQLWNGVRHNWATFGYGNLTFQTNFPGLSVVGPQNGASFPMLIQVSLADGSRFNFTYNTWGQVYVISNFAPNGQEQNHIRYDLPQNASVAQSDCPRFTVRGDFVQKWNNNAEVPTQFFFGPDHSLGQLTAPDGTIFKELFATSGVQKGLTTQSEVWSGGVRRKWTTITWVQDGVSYRQNPRVSETNVYDEAGNRRRATISYNTFNLPSGQPCSLPSDSYEYAANASTVLRRTHTDYNLSSSYISSTRRIIGLPTFQYLYDGSPGTLMSKVETTYDDSSLLQATPTAPVQHDEANFSSSFVLGRANVSRGLRYDVVAGSFVESQGGVNSAGSIVFSRDPLGHQVSLSFIDSFAATGTSIPGATYAYPTTVTDGDGFSSTSQYDYEHGAVRRAQDPKGAFSTTTYDAAGRLARNDVSNGAYTRFLYPNAASTAQGLISFTLIQTGGAEFYSEQLFDGAGRVIAATCDFPGSTGAFRGQFTAYDIMGRQSSASNPIEITGQWIPAGDDAQTGWIYTNQAHDWKGRPTLTTNTDQTTTELTYGGCGCAGGEVVTARDEVNRRQRITSDVLGRPVKTEVLNFDQTVYSTRTDTYNGRDQLTRIFVQQGASGPGQETLMTYDGHGRLATRKTPVEGSPDLYTYNADDTVLKVTDPRGANSNFVYNARHLVTGITYLKTGFGPEPAGISPAPAVSLGYDSAGNRLSMTDGAGSVAYLYDTWSRLTSETRTFNDLSGSYPLTYEYNLAGRLKKLTDPFGAVINYLYNDAGQLNSVTASGFPNVSQFVSSMQYRAWGGVKHCTYFNNTNLNISYNARMLMSRFELGNSGSDYQYYDDARVRFASNLQNNSFDRKYIYDHVGRLTQGLTGTEARDGSVSDGPYKQVYQYDTFDNLTSRTNRFWTQPDDGYTASYVNDRNIAWNYDSAGNIKDDTMSHTYDVLSRQTNAHDLTTNIDQSYDGDSRPAKRAENRSGFISSLYYVRSSVLGGQVVSELNTTGQNAGTHKTHIYVNGSEIALYDSWINVVIGRLSNPVTGSGWQETDPLGGYVGFVDPFPANPDTDYASLHPGEALFFQDANPFDSGSGCTQDEMPTDCNRQNQQLENGTVGVRIGLGRNIYAINNFQRGFGFGGVWISSPTPSEPGGPTEPDGTMRIVGSDNAYADVWVPFSDLSQNAGFQYDRREDFRDYARSLSNKRGQQGYSDCLSLALLVYKAGQLWEHSAGGIVNGLLNGLTERGGRFSSSDPNYRVGVFSNDTYFERSFGDTGFNGNYQGGAYAPDPGSPNQVRHFVAWFAAGYLATGITSVAADARELLYGQEGGERNPTRSPDVALGLAGIQLGERFRGDYKKLANDVWHDICGQSGNLNLP